MALSAAQQTQYDALVKQVSDAQANYNGHVSIRDSAKAMIDQCNVSGNCNITEIQALATALQKETTAVANAKTALDNANAALVAFQSTIDKQTQQATEALATDPEYNIKKQVIEFASKAEAVKAKIIADTNTIAQKNSKTILIIGIVSSVIIISAVIYFISSKRLPAMAIKA